MGWENVFHCEWNPFGQKVLKYYWPNAISYNDITKTDFTIHRGRIDILTGGFPCQPYSMAGKRKGKEDERHLWPEMLRAIREIQPRWVVGENVFGLVNWSGGLVFHEVQADLEAEGYEVQPYVLPACSVNAPHRRDRVWFVAKNTISCGRIFGKSDEERAEIRQQRDIGAGDTERFCGEKMAGLATHSNSNGFDGSDRKHEKQSSERGVDALHDIEQMGMDVTNATSDGLHDESAERDNGIWQDNQQSRSQRISTAEGISDEWTFTDTQNTRLSTRFDKSREKQFRGRNLTMGTIQWARFPSVPPVCYGNDGIPSRLDGITFPKWRNESIKAGGNAVVPQVVYQIFKTIVDYENMHQ